MPAGFTQQDLGKCDYAIRVPGAGGMAYEVGVVRRRDGKDGYTFLYDFYGGGGGLIQKLYGEDRADEFKAWNKHQSDGHGPIRPLMKEYEVQQTIKVAKRNSAYAEFEVKRERLNGATKIRLVEKGGTL